MSDSRNSQTARGNILASIRAHLNASVVHERNVATTPFEAVRPPNGSPASVLSTVELFKANLEAVNGHCLIAETELDTVHALTRIIDGLKRTKLDARRIAVSDAKGLLRLVRQIAVEVDEVKGTPSADELFHFDVGVTTAQAAIAETGTLVLDSSQERNRLISLVPPVHIAIVDASAIHLTLSETLSTLLTSTNEVSPVITFITGPSRTADIELTLTIGVHGPQELYVIVNNGQPVTRD